jgi:hypothetical protein
MQANRFFQETRGGFNALLDSDFPDYSDHRRAAWLRSYIIRRGRHRQDLFRHIPGAVSGQFAPPRATEDDVGGDVAAAPKGVQI